jgi:hypothetical protein
MGDKQALIAWAAGFIDGEGSIMVVKHKPHNGVSPSYYVRLKVNNTRLEPLLRLKSLFGGYIIEHKYTAPAKHWKNLFNWVIQGRSASFCLEQILPHLTIKARQAKLGLELECLKAAKQHQKTVALTDRELKRRELILREIKVLNERGKPKRSIQLALAPEEEKQASLSLLLD